MVTVSVGSILTSIGMFLCVGAILLVALAFILFRLITGSSQAGSDSEIWEPQQPEGPRYRAGSVVSSSRLSGIPSTGGRRRVRRGGPAISPTTGSNHQDVIGSEEDDPDFDEGRKSSGLPKR